MDTEQIDESRKENISITVSDEMQSLKLHPTIPVWNDSILLKKNDMFSVDIRKDKSSLILAFDNLSPESAWRRFYICK
jgi:hypothetical protein